MFPLPVLLLLSQTYKLKTPWNSSNCPCLAVSQSTALCLQAFLSRASVPSSSARLTVPWAPGSLLIPLKCSDRRSPMASWWSGSVALYLLPHLPLWNLAVCRIFVGFLSHCPQILLILCHLWQFSSAAQQLSLMFPSILFLQLFYNQQLWGMKFTLEVSATLPNCSRYYQTFICVLCHFPGVQTHISHFLPRTPLLCPSVTVKWIYPKSDLSFPVSFLCILFPLLYHSPSLTPGHAPYPILPSPPYSICQQILLFLLSTELMSLPCLFSPTTVRGPTHCWTWSAF